MKIIVGLGNPGKKYQNSRHNVGHMFIDYAGSLSSRAERGIFKLVKTDCFMNQSGIFVKKLKVKLENLYIVHDDLDIPLGKFHVQFGVGPLLHNGLESIEQHLNTKDFWRIRIGIDNRKFQTDGEAYVLSDFTEEEKKFLQQEAFPKILSQLKQSHEIH